MPKRHDGKRRHHKKHGYKQKCDLTSSCSSYSFTCSIPEVVTKKFIYAFNTAGFVYPNNTNFSYVPFDTVGASDGWTLNTVNGISLFTCPKTGTYQITYTANVQNRGTTTNLIHITRAEEQNVLFRLFKNSTTTIPGSNSWSAVNVSEHFEFNYMNGSGTRVKATFTEVSNNIIVSLNAGDTISLATAGTIYGDESTLLLSTTLDLLNLTNVEPAKIAIVEIA